MQNKLENNTFQYFHALSSIFMLNFIYFHFQIAKVKVLYEIRLLSMDANEDGLLDL